MPNLLRKRIAKQTKQFLKPKLKSKKVERARCGEEASQLSISADDQVVPIGTIKSQDIEDDNAFGGINDLADAQQRSALWQTEKFGGAWIGGGGVDFFVGIAELNVIIALQGGE